MKKDTFYRNSLICLLASLMFFITPSGMFAQINVGGTPYSFKENLRDNYLPVEIMERFDLNAVHQEDIEDELYGRPWRFGVDIKVQLNLHNSGTWKTLPNGDRIWQLKIISPNALSINLIYDDFYLPEGGKLYLYNEDKTSLIGGFTNLNNKAHRKFSTGITSGETTILEYYEPRSVEGQGVISIAKVVHGYRSLETKFRDFMDSGNCHVNINCTPEGDNFQDEKRATAMILLSNNTRICTGALVNNTQEDGRPFFLTANHCNNSGTSNTWIFMFNYESPDCSITDGPTTQTVSGSTLRANNAGSDVLLLELDENPNVNFQPYFAGWSRLAPTTGGVMIHHPSGDIKKIATYTVTPTVGNSGNPSAPPSPGNYWFISSWAATTNGQSIPEGGSSGAPVFNDEGKIIGQHRRSSQLNCSNPNAEFSWTGQFGVSWNNGTNSASRLRDWLDPNNLNPDEICGAYYCIDDIVVDYPINSSRSYTASNSITASSIVNGSSEVYFQAGEEILLTAGFTFDAQGTGTFSAVIAPCTAPMRPMLSEDETVVDTDGNEDEGLFREKLEDIAISVYPNPTNASIRIEVLGNFSYELHSMLGALILKGSPNEKDFTRVDLSNLPEGMYLLKIIVGNKTFSKKIAKKSR